MKKVLELFGLPCQLGPYISKIYFLFHIAEYLKRCGALFVLEAAIYEH